MKTLSTMCRALALLCAVAGLPEVRATTWEGTPSPRARVTGKVAIISTIHPNGSGAKRKRNLEKLRKLWEERTYPHTNDISRLVLMQLLETPRASLKRVEYKRWILKFDVATYAHGALSFKRKIRRMSRIPSADRPEGKIRWKTRVNLSVAPWPAS